MTCVNSKLSPGADEASGTYGNHGITSATIDSQWQLLEDFPEVQQVYLAADSTKSHDASYLNGSVMLR